MVQSNIHVILKGIVCLYLLLPPLVINLCFPFKAWFPYRCICRICRVCRTKKIHRTDTTFLPYKCSMQKKRQIQLVVRDRMNSICPMNFLRTTDTTDTTIWKPSLRLLPTFAGALRQKNRTRVSLDKTLTNYIS